LDAVLRRRVRTVSRGFLPTAGLAPPWDTSTASAFQGSPFGGSDFAGAADRDHASGAALALDAAYAEQAARARPGPPGTSAAAAQFVFRAPLRAGFGARREAVDAGACRFRGDPRVKALDARSRALVGAADRGAWAGVAPMPNNARKARDHGSRLVMKDALDIIAQENRERGYM
jgi:hypothetical protein